MAKKFKFRLQPVLKYRNFIEEQMRQRYGEITQIQQAKERDLEELKEHSRKAADAMVDSRSGSIDMHRVRVLNRYVTGLNVSTQQREGELRAIDKEVEKRREELVAARRGVKSMEKLKERRLSEHEYEELRDETKDLDEVGSIGVRRRKLDEEQH